MRAELPPRADKDSWDLLNILEKALFPINMGTMQAMLEIGMVPTANSLSAGSRSGRKVFRRVL